MKLILREVGIAFVILLFFMLVGDRFLRMMSLTDLSLRLGGGIVLFLIALRMIFRIRTARSATIRVRAASRSSCRSRFRRSPGRPRSRR